MASNADTFAMLSFLLVVFAATVRCTHMHAPLMMGTPGDEFMIKDQANLNLETENHILHMDMGNKTHDMMQMYFHFGVTEYILFKGWRTTTAGGMAVSVFGVLLLGVLYEGLKYFREFLFKKYVSKMQFSTVAITGENGKVTQVHKVENHRMLSVAHAVQTSLHVVQIILSYFLMLIFMTYNVWLCIGVVLGTATGYFVFGWRKATVVDITEHCH